MVYEGQCYLPIEHFEAVDLIIQLDNNSPCKRACRLSPREFEAQSLMQPGRIITRGENTYAGGFRY